MKSRISRCWLDKAKLFSLLYRVIFGLLLLTLLTTPGFAKEKVQRPAAVQAQKLISYQGRISRPDGSPVPNGTYSMHFALFRTQTGGATVWSESQTVFVENGAFSALLGQAEPFDPELWDGSPYWLETSVEGQLLSPRLAIASTPYAITILPGAVVTGDLDDQPILSIENKSPAPVAEALRATTQVGRAVYGVSTDGVGVEGLSENFRGVNGISETGDGVFGHAHGDGVGVRGLSYSGDGVQGIAETGHAGVRGVSQSGQIGVLGVSEGPPTVGDTAFGVAGFADHENGIGVFGTSINGWPIKGITPSEHPAIWGDNIGSGMGIFGTSVGGPGVRGKSVNDYGVLGQSESGEASVFGWSVNPVGVRGQSFYSDGVYGNSSEGRGVYGQSASAAGVYGESINEAGVIGTSSNHEGVKGLLPTSGRETAAVLGENQGHGIGVKGTTAADHWTVAAVQGENTGSGIGVKGTTSSDNSTVAAIHAENLGAGYGLYASTGSGFAQVSAIRAENTGQGTGVQARTSSSDDTVAAVLGENHGSGYGVKGTTSSETATVAAVLGENVGAGIGVQGLSSSAAGLSGQSVSGPGVKGSSVTGIGVSGVANGTAAGVYGENMVGTGVGVGGTSNNAAGVRGFSTNGPGVRAESVNSHGLSATTSSSDPNDAAVYASNTGQGFGVSGMANGTAPGVYGENTAGTGAGVRGTSTNGPGVRAESANGHGLSSTTSSSDPNDAAVYASNTGQGFGIYGRSEDRWGVAGVTYSNWDQMSAIQGQNYGTGHGVAGKAQGNVSALYGKNSSTGNGVYGESVEGTGVRGISESASSDSAGVLGVSNGNGIGVWGWAGGSNHGVYGHSADYHGVYGYSDHLWSDSEALGSVAGVSGEANAARGFGVVGSSYSGPAAVIGGAAWNEYGQVGDILTPAGYEPVGVAGVSWHGHGVYGSSIEGFGVIARTDQASYALVSLGSAWVGGNLVVTGAKTGYTVDVALNVDSQALETGDVVIITGVAEAVVGDIPVLMVRRADEAASSAVVGVVDKHYTFDPLESERSSSDLTESSRFGGAGTETARVPEGAREPMKRPTPPGENRPDSSGQTQKSPYLIQQPAAPGEYVTIVTLGSYMRIKVDASYGAIQPGDLLTSSPNAGYAMRADEPQLGTVIGKALGALESGEGMVPVLVTLQ